ncbi:MAG: type II toxin-antitoxin system YafQ family toxin [Bacteroidales bacterium]|nr:type II toxin-antitoxin system YafQ family toxin [Bacteroidales bacterium]
MWNLIQTGQFKKDLKRYKNQPAKINALGVILKHLSENGTVPASCRPHALSGDWSGYYECHILNDFLLIWKDPKTGNIYLARLGSHSELFGK